MRNKYTLSEFLSNTYAWIITKLFYKKARLIRRPFYIRGKSDFQYGRGLTTGHGCRFDLLGKGKKTLFIGNNCEIGDYVHIVAHEKVMIGNDCLLASKIFISDTNHGSYHGEKQSSPNFLPNSRILTTAQVKIGNRVWIGENVVILQGVVIGDGVIIGANSFVNKDIPSNCIAAGNPAKVIKAWNKRLEIWTKLSKQL